MVATHREVMGAAYTNLCPDFAATITPASIGALWDQHWSLAERDAAWGVMAYQVADGGSEKLLGIVRGQWDCTLDLAPALAPNLNPALLAQVYVAEAARGRGVGSKLVNIMLDILAGKAQSTGQRQAISAVHPDNHAGQGLQTKAGGVMMLDTYTVHYDNFGVSKEVRLIHHDLTKRHQPNPAVQEILQGGRVR